MISTNHALGHIDVAKREFLRMIGRPTDTLSPDCNYIAVLSELALAASRMGEREHIEKIYARLLPYAGQNVASIFCYLGPVHDALAACQHALGRDAFTRTHLQYALADAERLDAKPWIAKIQEKLLGSRGLGV
jgi:hypothetical protein